MTAAGIRRRLKAPSSAGARSPAIVRSNIGRLAAEIDDGTWEQKYGHLREQESIDLGYRLVICG